MTRMVHLVKQWVMNRFHHYYYQDSRSTWEDTHWMGVPVLKLPLDLWVYQEVVYETSPDVIVETGTHMGGSSLFFANLFDLTGNGRVITVDIEHPPGAVMPVHRRIEYLLGSSTSPEVAEAVRSRIRADERIMVILDSDHSERHVREELALYAPLVTPGCYLVVEDTNVNGHPVFRSHGPGPMEALEDFLAHNPEFASDLHRERFMVTFSPRGWVRRLGKETLSGKASARESCEVR
jgi:cephalosporin hydroxylase